MDSMAYLRGHWAMAPLAKTIFPPYEKIGKHGLAPVVPKHYLLTSEHLASAWIEVEATNLDDTHLMSRYVRDTVNKTNPKC